MATTKADLTTPDQSIVNPKATNEQQAGEQTGKTETTPEPDGICEIARQVEAKLMRGGDTLTRDEQNTLCASIDGMGEAEEDVLVGVAILVVNLTDPLIYHLGHWLYRRGKRAVVHKLLQAHLNDVSGEEDVLMSVQKVGNLMDCQIVKEELEKEMGLR